MRFITGILALLPATAAAAYPDDIRLSELGTWNDQALIDTKPATQAYDQLIKELAVSVANKPLSPAETLGISGFDVALTSSLAFISADSDNPNDPDPWERAHAEGDPSHLLWIPGITARKGLPLSLELGASMGYLAFSRQTTYGVFGRWGLIEGYKKYPDLSMQLGYSGYLGNSELKLGALDYSTTIGYTAPFGRLIGIHTAAISPYAGAGLVRLNATPYMSDADQASLGIAPVSGFKNNDNFAEGNTLLNLHLGFRLQTGDFQILAATTWAPSAIATVNCGMGYVF